MSALTFSHHSTFPFFLPSPDVRKGKNLASDVHLYPVPEWPPQETLDRLGQVSGVSIDAYGNPVVFHRGDRTWNAGTFRSNNEYAGDRYAVTAHAQASLV